MIQSLKKSWLEDDPFCRDNTSLCFFPFPTVSGTSESCCHWTSLTSPTKKVTARVATWWRSTFVDWYGYIYASQNVPLETYMKKLVVWEATFFFGVLAYFLVGTMVVLGRIIRLAKKKERSWDGQTLSWHDTSHII